ncbi:MAG: Unknown protein [uncultured Campylobacterales bacterium]|uniref:Exosortase F system-associated protein n=1 Tax=uncultured Campylobacterales bacterium TaxID=352960 RepID=A0A6S6SZM9_9BACT|nr:MAG: Unknown protein [uncultured Campylobacterales bacterium]
MKFFISNDIRKNDTLKTVITLFLFCLVFYIGLDFYLKLEYFGFSIDELINTIRGDEEYFLDPVSFKDLVEMIHIHSFFALIYFAMILGIMFRLKTRLILFFIVVSVLSLLCSYILLLLSTHYDVFVYLVGSYVLFNIVIIFGIFMIMVKLWFLRV